MTKNAKLVFIKIVHTIIWSGFNIVIFYMLFAAVTNRLDLWLWLGYALILGECLVLLIFRSSCPLTIVARRYSNSNANNFDIYLPNWIAKNNKLIYSMIVLVTIFITLFQAVYRKFYE